MAGQEKMIKNSELQTLPSFAVLYWQFCSSSLFGMKTCSIWNICWLSNRVLSLHGRCIRMKICFLWKKAVQPRGMTKSQSVASTSATPAKLLSIYPQKLLDLPRCCPHPCRWMCRCRSLPAVCRRKLSSFCSNLFPVFAVCLRQLQEDPHHNIEDPTTRPV